MTQPRAFHHTAGLAQELPAPPPLGPKDESGRGRGRGRGKARGRARGGRGGGPVSSRPALIDQHSQDQQQQQRNTHTKPGSNENQRQNLLRNDQRNHPSALSAGTPSSNWATATTTATATPSQRSPHNPNPNPTPKSRSRPNPDLNPKPIPQSSEDELEEARLLESRERERLAKVQLEERLYREFLQFQSRCRDWKGDDNVMETMMQFDLHGDMNGVSNVMLGRQIRGLWESTRPSEKDVRNRRSIIEKLQKLVSERWPGHGLKVSSFGSNLTGLASSTSDLDLVLLDPSHPGGPGTPPEEVRYRNSSVRLIDGRPDWESVNVLSKLISSNKGKSLGFIKVERVANASTPIVKFVDQTTGIQVDLNCNDRFGTANSLLISAYADIRKSLVRPLMNFIKYWSKCKNLNDPSGRHGSASFSSYSLCLMVLHYLQYERELPYLQSQGTLERFKIPSSLEFAYLRPQRRRFVRNRQQAEIERNQKPCTKCDITFPKDVEEWEEFLELEAEEEVYRDQALGKAAYGFFKYFSQFNRQQFGVSILYKKLELHPSRETQSKEEELPEWRLKQRSIYSGDLQPKTLPNFEKKEFPPKEWKDSSWVVQDPLILNRNTSRALREPNSVRFKKELELAVYEINLGSNLARVCQDYRLTA